MYHNNTHFVKAVLPVGTRVGSYYRGKGGRYLYTQIAESMTGVVRSCGQPQGDGYVPVVLTFDGPNQMVGKSEIHWA
jgi:hypothetical protein